MTSINLPSGLLVNLIDPADVTEGSRLRVRLKMAALSKECRRAINLPPGDDREVAIGDAITPDDVQVMSELACITLAALIKSWSSDVPITADALLDLSGRDFDALQAATGEQQARLIVGVDTSPNPAEGSPTVPSAA